MRRKIEVEETASHKFWLLSRNFCAPIKVAPMARAMPAIPWIGHWVEWTVSTKQLLCNTLWQKYCKNAVIFVCTIVCTELTTRMKYSTLILMCVLDWWTPSVNDILFLLQKSYHRIKEHVMLLPANPTKHYLRKTRL